MPAGPGSAGIWKRFLLTGLPLAAGAVVSYTHVISKVENQGEGIYYAHGHLAFVWLGSITAASLLLFQARTRRWLPVLLGIVAVGDAFLTRRSCRAGDVFRGSGTARVEQDRRPPQRQS